MKDFIINILIEISFLVVLAVIYYYYQKKRLTKIKIDFSLEEELKDFQLFINNRISETIFDQDLIDFNEKLIEELQSPKKESTIVILKNYYPKIKDELVLEAITEFQNVLKDN